MLITVKQKNMSEQLQTRTEHSRSLEDAKKYEAIHTLKDVGLLIPLSEIETYHGRLGHAEEDQAWQVDPTFANGSNDSGNSNVNSRPTLYTGDQVTARQFAHERGNDSIRSRMQEVGEQEVRAYSNEEKQGWILRLDERDQRRYENQVGWYANRPSANAPEPKKHTPEDLEGQWVIQEEAKDLYNRMPEEKQREIRAAAARGLRAEVHKIAVADEDATVLDFAFDPSKLDEEDKGRYEAAIKALVLPVTEGSPVSFEDKDKISSFVGAVNSLGKGRGMISSDDVVEIASWSGVSLETVNQLAGSYNSRVVALVQPSYLVHSLLKHGSSDIVIKDMKIGEERQATPLNLEYAQRYLRQAHIVGVKQRIDSATLGGNITSVSFFDLEKTSTETVLEEDKELMWQKLGGVATALTETNPETPTGPERNEVLQLLDDAYVKPERLVQAAKQVEGYDAIFEADAGNWEGFTLEEHTETVLRNFDENFADKIPVELIGPMRLLILEHDLGKPVAVRNGEKHRQKEYNVAQAEDFLTKLDVNEGMKGILSDILGDGVDLAFQINIRGAGEQAVAELSDLARRSLTEFHNGEEVADDQIDGFIEMCNMLLICDGGAYTSMAITRRPKGGRYRNAPSFNKSFAQPVGFGKRDIRIRGHEDEPAANDLTPKI